MQAKFVDVWHGRLPELGENASSMGACLSESEQQKAATFKQAVMRQRYIGVRALLRQTLAVYLQMDPAQVKFQTGVHGKPFLPDEALHFNISHTADELLIAVGNIPDIGIDIEITRPRHGMDGLAARCFSAVELEAWQSLPAEARLAAFYRLWTKKEAFVKAVGRGIALGLERCEVQIQPDGQLLRIPAEFGSAGDWLVTELSLAADKMAALATPKCGFTLQRMSLRTELDV